MNRFSLVLFILLTSLAIGCCKRAPQGCGLSGCCQVHLSPPVACAEACCDSAEEEPPPVEVPVKNLGAEDRNRLKNVAPETLDRINGREPLTVGDVIVLSRLGISSGVIMSQLDQSGTSLELTEEEVSNLEAAGVHQDVIDYITGC